MDTTRHTWTDGPFAFLLERGPGTDLWIEFNGGSRERVTDQQLGREILRLAEELEQARRMYGRACGERETLAEETERLKAALGGAARQIGDLTTRNADLRLEVERQRSVEWSARQAQNEVNETIEKAVVAAQARIKRKLLEEIDDLRVEAGSVKGDELRLWIVPSHLVAALDRICPEEG